MRARHEHQIKRNSTRFGGEFERALFAMIRKHGLAWFTDEQIAEIRDLMVKTEWNRRARMNASRASYRAAAGRKQEAA